MDPLVRPLSDSADPLNPPAPMLRELLASARNIGVVGMSRDPAKAARRVPSYLATKGYEIYPVNPFAHRMLGRPVRRTLDQITDPLDIVLVFRPSQEAGAVVQQAAARPEKPAVWLQEGILAPEATARARAKGIVVIQDLCIFKVHRALGEPLLPTPSHRSPRE